MEESVFLDGPEGMRDDTSAKKGFPQEKV